MTALDVALAMSIDAFPLGLVDQFLLDVHAGQALILLFVLVMLASVPLGSRKVLAINLTLFGLIFMLTPFWVVDDYELYLFAGIGLVFIGTMFFAFADS